MAKIIVKNISGMGWKARIGLIAIFTLTLSVFIYDGLYRAKGSTAAVTTGTAWQSVHATAPGTAVARNKDYVVTSSGYTAANGSNRLLLVAINLELATAASFAGGINVTFGGVTVNPIVTTENGANLGHVWLGYIADANIPAVSSTVTATFSRVSVATNVSSVAIKVGSYTGVDQGAPVVGSSVNYAGAVTVAGAAAVSYITGGKTVVATSNGGVTATPAYTAIPTLTTNAGATSTTGQSAYIAETAAHTSSSSGTVSITYSGTTAANSTVAIASLRPATTTLGNGTIGSNTTVAPGAADQKIDGFSFITGSAGTTDSVTGLTVTTTNQAAIASMRIMNEAGTTQYFSTVNNPGSNTWTFSGGTPIPVTSTISNYKIYVTFKTRAAGAPEGTTATTASVTGVTSNNVFAGTDTADTTLTLSNVHLASTWGTITPGDRQFVLNWTKGTASQSVIIIRYTGANTDTTKPVDGTTYSVGNAFGTGGIVRYNGTASTYTDTNALVNGTTYYYKIFEYDAYTNYYNATDVWTGALVPVSADPTPPTVDAGFAATTPVNTTAIPITSYTASDIGLGVAGYLITTTSAQPSAGDAGWTPTPPGTFTVGGQGSYTFYPWAKDGGGNVSALYGTPVTVVVDLTKPTVSTFTANSPSPSLTIPIQGFTAADSGGAGMAGYMITTSSIPPAFDAEGWSASAPSTFAVGSDGSYNLYPWAKDAAGNVSAVFASPRTVLVDTTAPTGLLATSPADEAVDLPLATSLQCTAASDGSGVGGVMYQYQIDGDSGYSQNSGWVASTTYAPTGLAKGVRYVWTVKAKDSLGNETALTTPRSFTIIAPCVRNNPTLTLLTPAQGIASTISAYSGTSTYNLKIWNNDTGDCGPTTFDLFLTDTDPSNHFDDSTLAVPQVTLATGANTTTTVTVKASAGEDSGVLKTIATSSDPNHSSMETGFVQTTLNVVSCVAKTPLMIVGPDSGYLNRSGQFVYTVTLKNTDTGAACPDVVYNLSVVGETNSTDFNASQLASTAVTLSSGKLGSVALTVSAKSTAVKNAINLTTLQLTATGHTSPPNVTVKSTVNNPMLHNSDNTGSTKWTVSGGWGIPNGRYGEIKCVTCHLGGGGDTANVKRMNEKIFTPYTTGTSDRFPGNGQTIAYRRYVGNSPTKPVLGWDATPASPRTSSTKICEVCHTYDSKSSKGVKAHPYSSYSAGVGMTLGNHFNTDGTDCTRCHKHNRGFGAANMLCNSCHGDPSAETITPANRYVVAPPITTTQLTGTITGIGQVSSNPKVGAHQTHLQFLNGFSNYSTVDFRCTGCHGNGTGNGAIPTDFSHANGSSTPVFQGLANNRGARTATFSANLTCSNTYCHNPAGTGGTLAAANAGPAILPNWTSASYLTDAVRKSMTNCNRCHKVPGDAGFTSTFNHGGRVTNEATDCATCHEHNGDGAGSVGRRHIDGIKYAANGHNMPYPGSAHLSIAGTSPWGTCTVCHTNGGNDIYPADPVGSAPDCTSCHKRPSDETTFGMRTPSGTSSCYDCHGATATNGMPNGKSFPNYSGSHRAHVVTQGMTCANCHGSYGGGINDPNHGYSNSTVHAFAFVNVTSTSNAFHYTPTGKGSCSTNTCHPTMEWGGPKLQCNSCHSYLATDAWVSAYGIEGIGAHVKHINYLTTRAGVTLNASTDAFGGAAYNAVCGVCHSVNPSDHSMTKAVNSRTINFGGSTARQFVSGSPVYNGVNGNSSSINPKSCSNIDCHYLTSPIWSTY